jgi:predicted DNA-binding protein with PD1-like motif
MQHKLLNDNGGQRTFAVILDSGDEVLKSLQSFVNDQRIHAAQFTAIGALSNVVLKYFDWQAKDYLEIRVAEQVEVASLIGDVATAPSGEPALHVHIVVGRRDGTAMAGHLGEAHVRPTLEVVLTESPAHLHKVMDPKTGLALIRMED